MTNLDLNSGLITLGLAVLSPVPPPKVAQPVVEGFVWGGLSISLGFVIFRLVVRIVKLRRLFFDDAWVVLAWLCLLVIAVLTQVMLKEWYLLTRLASGQLIIPPPDILQKGERNMRIHATSYMLFYTSLWSIKLSFLIFFRRLDHTVKAQRVLWWGVFIITVVTYLICIGTFDWYCFSGPILEVPQRCYAPHRIKYTIKSIKIPTALDVVTDALLIFLPIHLLWRAKITRRQKLLLSGIFSLSIVVIVIAIVRVAVNTAKPGQQLESTWVFLWSFIEASVAVMVSCVASFRTLFVKQPDRPSNQKPSKSSSEKIQDIESGNHGTRTSNSSTTKLTSKLGIMKRGWKSTSRTAVGSASINSGSGPDTIGASGNHSANSSNAFESSHHHHHDVAPTMMTPLPTINTDPLDHGNEISNKKRSGIGIFLSRKSLPNPALDGATIEEEVKRIRSSTHMSTPPPMRRSISSTFITTTNNNNHDRASLDVDDTVLAHPESVHVRKDITVSSQTDDDYYPPPPPPPPPPPRSSSFVQAPEHPPPSTPEHISANRTRTRPRVPSSDTLAQAEAYGYVSTFSPMKVYQEEQQRRMTLGEPVSDEGGIAATAAVSPTVVAIDPDVPPPPPPPSSSPPPPPHPQRRRRIPRPGNIRINTNTGVMEDRTQWRYGRAWRLDDFRHETSLPHSPNSPRFTQSPTSQRGYQEQPEQQQESNSSYGNVEDLEDDGDGDGNGDDRGLQTRVLF
ncbi:MAG: hypothetical protein M1823_006087 [Watsoniomyces obsoletus]|nr:MAG: hypothetical protein M1823_006087 [Watsoniomyces obsoletus]